MQEQQVGLYQTILDQGPEIGALLFSVREDTAGAGRFYRFRVLPRSPYRGLSCALSASSQGELDFRNAEPLSVREGEILNLIAQGRSNKEIARILSITPETVKSHVKHIFNKLDVQKRAQAVSRAQSLGLVGTPTSMPELRHRL